MSLADRPLLPSVRAPSRAGEGRLGDWWPGWRNRLIRSRRFQRWAASFPFVRSVARRKARSLFDLVAGFVYSQVLAAVVELNLLEALAERPLRLEAIMRLGGLPEDAARRLCEAATALDLMERRGTDRYGLGQLGAAMLGNPGIAAMVSHHGLLYADLADPVALLRDPARPTALSGFWAYASAAEPGRLPAEDVAAYSRLMAVSQDFIADEILDAVDLRGATHLLDVGGGEGAFIRAAAARHPALRFSLFDLPAVAARAETALAGAGLSARATACGGDLFRDALPAGADIATLVRVLYDHPDDKALAILAAVRRALPPGGQLLVAEPLAGTSGAEPMGAAYFAFYLLAMRGGASRSAAELADLLQRTGFSDIRQVPTRRPLFTGLLTARA